MIRVALHPGTTDAGLSRPFQAHVPADRLLVQERSVRQFPGIIDWLQHTASGGFFGWDGLIPW